MIQSFTITNHIGEKLFLDIRKPEDSGFLIKSVEGLASPKAEISSSNLASFDGVSVDSVRAEERNIVFDISFYDNNINHESIEELRHKCYTFFPIKREITIDVTNDSGTYRTTGIVESNETNIFTKEEGAQISVICPDSYFWKDELITEHIYSEIPGFEFPFEFDLVREFSEINRRKDLELYYDGVGDSGIEIVINATGNASNFIFYYINKKQAIKINSEMLLIKTGRNISYGDCIRIDTRRGHKSAVLIRDGKKYNIMKCIDINQSSWITIEHGMNRFSYTAEEGSTKLKVSVNYKTNYLGV